MSQMETTDDLRKRIIILRDELQAERAAATESTTYRLGLRFAIQRIEQTFGLRPERHGPRERIK